MLDCRSFLSVLFGDPIPTGSHILIWTLPNKVSHWCHDLDSAVQTVESVRTSAAGTYFGVGLSPAGYGAKSRCKADEILGIGGLWADFDVAGPAHKKPNLPPSREAISELLTELCAPPTMTVDSGHGIQCYWTFDRPLLFSTPEERITAASAVQRWNDILRNAAQAKGWDVDATHDLSRVLRLPGTVNRKIKGDERETSVIEYNPFVRFAGPAEFLSEIAESVVAATPVATNRRLASAHVVIADDLTLDPSADIDPEMLATLIDNVPKFNASWNHQRKDIGDQSGSAFDLSLASIAVSYGWTDQEIVNLLITHRRKWGLDLKLRPGYFNSTLRVARNRPPMSAPPAPIAELKAKVENEPAAEVEPEVEEAEGPPDTKDKHLFHISDMLGLQVRRIIKYTGSDPVYHMETELGEVRIGPISSLINESALRIRIADSVKHYVPHFKRGQWPPIANSLLQVSEDIDTGAETTEVGSLRVWINLYLMDTPPNGSLSKNVASAQQPFYHATGRDVCIFIPSMIDWLRKKWGEPMSAKKLGVALRQYGAKPEQPFYEDSSSESGKSRAYVWRLPTPEFVKG